MSDSLAQFEDRLRQLAPAGCDHLTEETFYRAGWNAAILSPGHQSSRSARHPRFVVPFVSGLLCGLLFCVASIFALTLTQEDPSVVQIRQVQVPAVQNLATHRELPSDDSSGSDKAQSKPGVAGQGNEWFAISATFGSWNWNHAFFSKDPIPLTSQPLSAAARHQWSSIVSTNPSKNTLQAQSVTSLSQPSEQLQLRAFPLSGTAIDELL